MVKEGGIRMKILIFGHKNPDTDSVLSAMLLQDFHRTLGWDTEAVILGNLNKETEFVFTKLGLQAPRYIDKVEEGQAVILVDHNDFAQSVENIENACIKMVVDHHCVGGFKTCEPLYYRAEPVGCTATIVYKMFQEKQMEISKTQAIMMLSAIISDTLLFKSPTCTKEDIKSADELALIAGIDVEEYGLELLKAGTDLSDLTAEQLITVDAKQVMLEDVKSVIAQVNTASIPDMMKRKAEIELAMANTIKEKELDVFVLAMTDIINSNSQAIVLGNRSDIVEKAYGVKLQDNTAFLEGVVSRKKQIIPILTKNV